MRWKILDMSIDEIVSLFLFYLYHFFELAHLKVETFPKCRSSLHFRQTCLVGFWKDTGLSQVSVLLRKLFDVLDQLNSDSFIIG